MKAHLWKRHLRQISPANVLPLARRGQQDPVRPPSPPRGLGDAALDRAGRAKGCQCHTGPAARIAAACSALTVLPAATCTWVIFLFKNLHPRFHCGRL